MIDWCLKNQFKSLMIVFIFYVFTGRKNSMKKFSSMEDLLGELPVVEATAYHSQDELDDVEPIWQYDHPHQDIGHPIEVDKPDEPSVVRARYSNIV